MDATLRDLALIEESAKKSALVWVRGPHGPARPLWHVWHQKAACVLGGPGEQPLSDLGLTDGARATVTARSKDKGGRLVVWPARVVELTPDGDAWRAAAEDLRGKRLNAADTEGLLPRWARECRLLRLEPAGAPEQGPGAMPAESGAAIPLATTATTRGRLPTGLPARRRARR